MSLAMYNRSSRGRRAVVALVLAAGASLSGCGLGDEGFDPGSAARVGDADITLDAVDEAGGQMCDLYQKLSDAGAAQGVSKGSARESALVMLVLRELGDELAAEHGTEPSAEFKARTESLAQQLTQLEVSPGLAEDVIPLTSSIDYFVDVVMQIGGGTDQQAYDDGIAVAQEWLDEHGLEVNPRFDTIELVGGEQLVKQTRDQTSVAVSGFARSALEYSTAAQPDPSYVDSLPESQRCG